MKTIRAIAIIFVLLATSSVFAADWPQYLGPTRNAVSSEKGLMKSWPAEGPKVLWTVPLGEGFGGPAISEGKVYIYDRVENKTGILRCINLATGKEEWTFSFEATGTVDHNGSRSVPSIDGNRIYICDPFGNFHCLDKNTHKVLWQKNIWKDFGGADVPRWAIAQNPLIYQNMVIVASQTDNAGLVAYDKQTGNVIWKSAKLPGSAGYVSPTIVKIGGEDQVVMISAQGMGMGGGRPPAGQGAPGGGAPAGGQGAPGGQAGSAPAAGQGAPGGAAGSAPASGQGAPGGAQGAGPGAGQGAPAGGGAAPTGGTPGAVCGFNPKTGALLWSYTGFSAPSPLIMSLSSEIISSLYVEDTKQDLRSSRLRRQETHTRQKSCLNHLNSAPMSILQSFTRIICTATAPQMTCVMVWSAWTSTALLNGRPKQIRYLIRADLYWLMI
jgi:outer membrane protein assembly factor BamB